MNDATAYLVHRMMSGLSVGLFFLVAAMAFAVALNRSTRHHRAAAWLLFAAAAGVYVMNFLEFMTREAYQPVVSSIGVSGYRWVQAAMLVVELVLVVTSGVALLWFRKRSGKDAVPHA